MSNTPYRGRQKATARGAVVGPGGRSVGHLEPSYTMGSSRDRQRARSEWMARIEEIGRSRLGRLRSSERKRLEDAVSTLDAGGSLAMAQRIALGHKRPRVSPQTDYTKQLERENLKIAALRRRLR